ncbi:B52 [Cordylochernes scorpioides]|uniref:B52 n=1 Tax=Cordylochernes scorpioides TaxID=51811 RepID=A0ABY6K7U8_9ARAC|nr:B52 [Cordylochernes scorpioides]
MVISEPKSAHLREVLLFAFNWKKSATEALRMLEEVHGDHALSKSQCYRWFKKFQSGDFELDNEPRGKPHQKFEDAEQQAFLDEDSTQTQEKLAKQLQVSQGAVSLRLNSLRMTQKLSRWVPHELSERQQERRLVTCEGLLARHEKKSFLHRIVTSDEKSIHFSNPMRQKSWGLLGQFPKQKPRPNRLGKKAMLCVCRYEQQMHSLREALNEIRSELREKHNKLILQHDNAPAHNATVVKNTIKDLGWELLPHPPYSPDLAPSVYHLFTSLGHVLKKQEFSNSDILRKWLVDCDEWQRASSDKEQPMDGTRVFIGHLSYDAQERDLARFFRGYGRISEILIKTGYGFVKFDDPRDAGDAVYELNGRTILGVPVNVEFARGPGARRYHDRPPPPYYYRRTYSPPGRYYPPPLPPPPPPPIRTDYRVIVENISGGVSWQDLKDYMRQAGEVTYADAHKSHPHEGLVEYTSYTGMRNAVEQLDDTELLGRRIRVYEERSRKRRSRSRAKLKLPCQADKRVYIGSRWTKGRHKLIVDPRISVLVDGTLHFRSLRPEDSGTYICHPLPPAPEVAHKIKVVGSPRVLTELRFQQDGAVPCHGDNEERLAGGIKRLVDRFQCRRAICRVVRLASRCDLLVEEKQPRYSYYFQLKVQISRLPDSACNLSCVRDAMEEDAREVSPRWLQIQRSLGR